MSRFITTENNKGEIPGKPIFIGNQKQKEININLIAYKEDSFVEKELNDINQIFNYIENSYNVWINIDGIHDVEKVKKICNAFNIHTLIIEDIVNTGLRSKSEIEDDYIFTVIKMMFLLNNQTLNAEQVSMYLTKNILLTFQERKGDVFEPIRERIRNKKGRIRSYSLGYLKYSLLDIIVDNYSSLVELFGEKVEDLEDRILLHPTRNILEDINKNKVELNYFKKNIRPAKESLNNFKIHRTNLISKKEQLFFNDLNDYIIRVYDSLDYSKNMLSEQLTVYSTNVNYKLNEIMKLLTIISVVFIPITFIAGIYGTNFKYIPELNLKYGYFIMWSIIIFVAVSMLIFFKKKQWF
ncbi:magnesium/cobalt transporter CorA [uncultured Tenacibaculum sp.]|uniref:magnesium/cobalt transporter CorA n=1 Tax=uncultured Tenacibaculum sp. TaxID=174713 RepID=UPI002604A3AC|nr:magnesium/cobalt transporter CorA [uncultured Tenacibaculum sp.]